VPVVVRILKRMKGPMREYMRSCWISLAVLVVVVLVGAIMGWPVGVLLFPGFILTGILLPGGGPHSGGVLALLTVALILLMNALLFAFPLFWLSRLVRAIRRSAAG